MVNLIFPVTTTSSEIEEFFAQTKKRKDVKFLVGVTEQLKDKFKVTSTNKSVKVFVFENKSRKEEIINALKDYATSGKIMVVRTPLGQEEIDKFVDSKADITFCTPKNHNRFVSFFLELGQKIIRSLFGFTPYKGDVNAICFGESPSEILREGYNISYATRVDRWKGYSYAEVDVSAPRVKLEYNKTNVAIMLGVWLFILLGAIVGTVVYFVFMPATFISVFVAISGLFLFGMALFIATAVALLKMNAGERYYDKAKEIKKEKKK